MSSRIGLCCKNLYFSCLTLLALFIFSSATPLFAAEDDEEFMLEEITVTAEKREAELQKVPIDITVIRPEEMDRSGVYSIYDIKKIIPDLETSSTTGNQVMISIRGVGGAENTLWNPINETTTAVHIDGIQLTRPNGFDNMFFDLQRIEVLKGPQGTLYGRGSTAGSMNMSTQKPILDDFGGNLTVEGGNYDLRRSEAALNIPVMEKLAFRVAGRWVKKGGYSDAGDGSSEARSGRLSMTWEPTDKDVITLTYDNGKTESNGYGNSGAYYMTFGGVEIVPIAPWTTENTTVLELPYKTRWYKGDSLKNGGVFGESSGYMAQWERELPFAYGVALYGHREMEEELAYLSSWTGLFPFADGVVQPTPGILTRVGMYLQTPSLSSHSVSKGETDSFEMRLLSKETITGGDKYEWVVGGMGQNDETYELNDLGANYWVNIETQSYGLFAQAAYEIFDKLNLSAGYRRAMDEKEYTGDYRLTTTGVPYKKAEWNENIYKINLNWFVTDSSMTFVQYSKGYKTGNINYGGEVHPPEFMDSYETGFKTRFFDNRLQINGTAYYYDYKNYTRWTSVIDCAYAADEPAPFEGAVSPNGICYDIASEPEGYNDDDPDNYDELGSPDNNIDRWDYVGQEDAPAITVSPGGATQMGANLNIMYLLTASDTFSFNGSYSKNEYKDYHIGNAILAMYPNADNARLDAELKSNRDGEAFGGSPYRFNVGYSHTEFIGIDMLSFNTTAFYNGKALDQIMLRYTDNQYSLSGVPAYWTMDAALTYNSSRWVPESTRWSARLWCNNIFGSEHLSSINYVDLSAYWAGSGGQPGTGYGSGNYITPRTFGLTLSFDF